MADIEASIDYPEYDDVPEIVNKNLIEQIKNRRQIRSTRKEF